jgi:hypothetical protein
MNLFAQYLRTGNPRCSTVYTDNSLGPLATNSLCIFRVRVCSLSYPACKVHVPYYNVVRGRYGSTTFFSHYIINGKVFENNLSNTKFVFLSLQLLSEIFLILRRTERDITIHARTSTCQIAVLLVRF